MPTISILNGLARGREVSFEPSDAPVPIGRAGSSHVLVPDAWVHPEHASIDFDGERYWIEDRGTPNGTYVNKARVERAALEDGDTLWLGKTKLRFRLTDAGTSPS